MRLYKHIRSNVWGLVAVFIALTGTAYATHPGGADTISTEDIINGQVLSQDIGTAEVKNSDIAASSVPSSKIVDGTIQGADVAADTLTGADVANTGSLGGAEIDEDSLGLVDSDGPFSSRVHVESLDTNTPYDAGDPATFVQLNDYELRSTNTGTQSEFVICSTGGYTSQVIVYRGGAVNSAADSRDDFSVTADSCSGEVDWNGVTATSQGDFRILLPGLDFVQGFGVSSGDPTILSIGSS